MTNPKPNQPGQKDRPKQRKSRHASRRAKKAPTLPDILYHACDADLGEQAKASGNLCLAGGRQLFMSRSESQAWLVAHRNFKNPAVLYINASRAKQASTEFQFNHRGLWQSPSVPLKHVLNLLPGFDSQYSAGGFPVYYGKDGPEIALIKVRRRFGTTWEIAKGKLESGEGPVECAIRELQEEMGAAMDLTVEHDLGFVRFGFMTPDREPRLKTMYVYQFRCAERVAKFSPALGESVEDVRWFSPAQADQVVTHRSLRPLMWQLLQKFGKGR
jgi:8-oxo-dGTP pyrophosphatase MutT (NUDIX family)